MADRTCAVCFESLDKPNPACPADESHAVPLDAPTPHQNTVTWGRVQDKVIHTSCAGPELFKIAWEVFDGKALDADGLCDICGKPLDALP